MDSFNRPKLDLRSLNDHELAELLETWGEKKFRAKQVSEWLWKKEIQSFQDCTNLSKELRSQLDAHTELKFVSIETIQKSTDGTIKSIFLLPDGNHVEGVLIPSKDFSRMTACISSQVGCSLTCKFCATGYLKLKRNLLAYEIIDQVRLIRNQAIQEYGVPLSNIVFMGMGEPLLNYRNVMQAIEKITSEQGMGMAARRITLSTAGIAKMIKKLANDQIRFEFALSLHAATDEKRNQIMPINESNSLPALKEALQYLYQKTKTQITLEYIVFHNFNDSLTDAHELLQFAKSVPCKINIIEYNPIAEANFLNARNERLQAFQDYLLGNGMIVNIRRSRGKDIDGACGQLALRKQRILENELVQR
ncbi:MAG: 23S rRNA (adenine(2503)-C(2))-methyltransferase RlmN [Bacteroidia bacterium]|nr:23S rRNA (adenine(2503)-C(2))-methyltransferase RlmN [Bacteroidia bacterium]